jgi:hypothetical protein
MNKRRTATRITLTESKRERLERLWFVYGNYGPKTTPGNHQFIQGILEHGLDLRPLQTKRTPKRDRPTEECEVAVEAVLASTGDAEEDAVRPGFLRLLPPTGGGRKPETPDPELKRMLEEMRRRLSAGRGRGNVNPGGEDAA